MFYSVCKRCGIPKQISEAPNCSHCTAYLKRIENTKKSVYTKPVRRVCLRCDKWFTSINNRVCDSCHNEVCDSFDNGVSLYITT